MGFGSIDTVCMRACVCACVRGGSVFLAAVCLPQMRKKFCRVGRPAEKLLKSTQPCLMASQPQTVGLSLALQ